MSNGIGFIRKKNEPEKSYITCRFDVSKEEDGRAILKSSEFIKKIIETEEVKNDKKVRVKTIAANDLPTEGALPTWTFEF